MDQFLYVRDFLHERVNAFQYSAVFRNNSELELNDSQALNSKNVAKFFNISDKVVSNELFECFWPFFRVGPYRVKAGF